MTTQAIKFTLTAEDLMSIPQVAKELGVHHATVYKWIGKKKIIPYRIANQVFLTKDQVKALKEGRGGNKT